jgi:hypothetical protein
MRKGVLLAVAASAVALSGGVRAQDWAGMGPILAAYYNEEMSKPKGWELTYSGLKDGVEQFTFIIRPDTVGIDTSWLDADDQMKRLMCGDDLPRSWIAGGMKVRVDMVVIRGSKREVTRGTKFITCA